MSYLQRLFSVIVLVILVAFSIFSVYKIKSSNQLGFYLLPAVENFITTYLPFLNLKLSTANNVVLTRAGIIKATNDARLQNGLGLLSEDTTLDISSEVKVMDMFTQQYFEHTSPDGKSVGDLATQAGYAYSVIGENLALGSTFLDDKSVVDAWMNSPGHRANILNGDYANIGVAVAKGIYQDSNVWILVQHFGKPLALCPSVDASLKMKIESEEIVITKLGFELDNEKGIIATMSQYDPKYGITLDIYNKKVIDYNTLVAKVKKDLDTYNSEVRKFNDCI